MKKTKILTILGTIPASCMAFLPLVSCSKDQKKEEDDPSKPGEHIVTPTEEQKKCSPGAGKTTGKYHFKFKEILLPSTFKVQVTAQSIASNPVAIQDVTVNTKDVDIEVIWRGDTNTTQTCYFTFTFQVEEDDKVLWTVKVDNCSFTYTKKESTVTSVELNHDKISIINASETATLKATVFPETVSQKVKWYNEDPSIATISEDGVITPIKPGLTYIWAAAQADLTVESAKCEIKVTPAKLQSIELDYTTQTIEIEHIGSLQILSTTPAEAIDNIETVKYESTEEEVATVDTSGKITTVSVGECDINVTATDKYGNEAQATCHVIVTPKPVPVSDITITGNRNVEITSNSITFEAVDQEQRSQTEKCLWTVVPNTARGTTHEIGTFTGNVLTLSNDAIKYGGSAIVKATYEKNNEEITAEYDVEIGTFVHFDSEQLKNGVIKSITSTASKEYIVIPSRYYYEDENGLVEKPITTISKLTNYSVVSSIYIPKTINSIILANDPLEQTNTKDLIVHPDNSKFTSTNLAGEQFHTIMEKPATGEPTKVVLGCLNSLLPTSVTEIGDMAFSSTQFLAGSQYAPKFSFANIVTIGANAFNYSNISKVEFGSKLTEIKESAFLNCTNLKQVTINATDQKVTIHNKAFDSAGRDGEFNFNILSGAKISKIGEFCFQNSKLLNFVANEGCSIDSIEKNAFYKSTALTTFSAPSSGIVRFGTYVDDECVGNVFDGCIKLHSVTFPSSCQIIGRNTFNECSSLTNVTFEGTNKWMMYNINGNTNIWEPSIESKDNATIIKSHTNYTYVTFHNQFSFVDSSSGLDVAAGSEFTLGEDGYLSIPQSVIQGTTSKAVYGVTENGFKNKTEIVTLDTTESLISTIKAYAFSGCSNIEVAMLGSTVTSLSTEAFKGCDKLTTLYLDSDTLFRSNDESDISLILTHVTKLYVNERILASNKGSWLANFKASQEGPVVSGYNLYVPIA